MASSKKATRRRKAKLLAARVKWVKYMEGQGWDWRSVLHPEFLRVVMAEIIRQVRAGVPSATRHWEVQEHHTVLSDGE